MKIIMFWIIIQILGIFIDFGIGFCSISFNLYYQVNEGVQKQQNQQNKQTYV